MEKPIRPIDIFALYLPGFFPNEVNDRLWGPGFTEWASVQNSRPGFPGHRQPNLPRHDLGYYDLRQPGSLLRQVELAKAAGLKGFAVYVYQFDAGPVLDEMLENLREIEDFSFFFVWANEPWTRNWDGESSKITLAAGEELKVAEALMDRIEPYFELPGYFRIGGRPVLGIYKPSALSDDARDYIRDYGRNRPENPSVFTIGFLTFQEPVSNWTDRMAQFPPHQTGWKRFAVWKVLGRKYFFYGPQIKQALRSLTRGSAIIPGITLAWDNSPRRGNLATVTLGFTFRKFEKWLRLATQYVWSQSEHGDIRQDLLIINAWNEWSEGTYLEPDVRNGDLALRIIRKILREGGLGKSTVVLIVHDLEFGGSQLQMLAIAERLKAFGLGLVIVAEAAGPLRGAFSDLGMLIIAGEQFIDKRVLFQSLSEKGVVAGISTSLAASHLFSSLTEAEIPGVQIVSEFPGEIQRRELFSEALRALTKASAVVFPSIILSGAWGQHLSELAHKKVLVKPQGLYTGRACKRLPLFLQLRIWLARLQGKKIILGVGYGERRKGFDLFIRTLRIASEHERLVPVWVGGLDGQLLNRMKVENPADYRWLRKNLVSWRRLQRGQMNTLYRSSSALLQLSREDPYPSAVIEALSHGCPAFVAEGRTGIQDLLRDISPAAVLSDDLGFLKVVQEAQFDEIHHNVVAARPRVFRDHHLGDYVSKILGTLGQSVDVVSAVVPTYNSEKWIEKRLENIESQTLVPAEVIIVDDGSVDGTLDMVKRYQLQSKLAIRIVESDGDRRGVFANWVRGAQLAAFSRVWIAEADDRAAKTFLKDMSELIDVSRAHGAFCDSIPIQVDGRPSGGQYFRQSYLKEFSNVAWWKQGGKVWGPNGVSQLLLPVNPIMNVSACLFDKRAFLEASREVVNKEKFGGCVDWVFYAHFVKRFSMAMNFDPLNFHMRHEDSVIHREIRDGSHFKFRDRALREIYKLSK